MNDLFGRDSQFFLDVVQGKIPGHSAVKQNGDNPDIDTTSDPEDVWDAGGLFPYQSAATLLEVSSDSSDDDGSPAGIGMHNVRIFGLDGSFNLIQETLTLNGTTVVPTVNTYLRIYAMEGQNSGSASSNVGTIILQVTGGGDIQAQISPDFGRSLMALYTIPAGKTGFLLSVFAGMFDATANASIRVQIITRKMVVNPIWIVGGEVSPANSGSSFLERDNQLPAIFIEKTDIRVTTREVTANNTRVQAGFEILLVDN